ncbi:MAG TPA: hypothetical protein VGD45_27495 [Steroidobacter sp.]|uniref:hypothetical protein n=1 Tax=Steroidobacter sp. TaxID=1978227 RepID=UPI002ED7D30E
MSWPIHNNGLRHVVAAVLSMAAVTADAQQVEPLDVVIVTGTRINQGHAPFRLEAFTVDAGTDLTESIELYSFASYAQRESSAPQNFRHPSRDEVVRAIYPDGFTPVEAIEETDYAATRW